MPGGERASRQGGTRAKTDIADARWLATLARAGLLRGSFCHRHTCGNCAWSPVNARNWWASAAPRRTD